MTVLSTTTAGITTGGTAGPHLVETALAGAFLLNASHTLVCRIRWNTTTDAADGHYAMLLLAGAPTTTFAGSWIWRETGFTANAIKCSRFTTSGLTENPSTAAGAWGSTTAWVHVAMVYDAPNALIRSYVNGVASGTGASATTLTGTNANGVRLLVGPGNCEYCDVGVFNKLLTPAEVARLATTRALQDRTGCIAWIPMVDPTSLVTEGFDFTGRGNSVVLANSGTGNPAVANGAPPTRWTREPGRLFLPAPTVSFSGAATSVTSAASQLRVSKAIAAAATSPTSAAGNLRVRKLTAGAATSVSSAGSTSLRVRKFFSAAASSPSSASAALRTRFNSGIATSPSSASGALRVRKFFASGIATSPSFASAFLEARLNFSGGSATSPSSAAGALRVRRIMTASGTSPSSAAAVLQVVGISAFAGLGASITSAAGQLRVRKPSSAAATSPSSAASSLRVTKPISASGTSPSSAASGLRVRKFLSAAGTSRSYAQAFMTGGTPIANASQPVDYRVRPRLIRFQRRKLRASFH